MALLLSDVSSDRDNNFNLIRFIAASMVIFYHAYPLTGTLGGPLNQFGLSLGHVAVDIFFVTSGFLITGSLMVRENMLAFIVARILRIYPALIVAVLFCVFVVGLYFTTQPTASYLSNPGVYQFIKNNVLLIAGPLYWYLPGVFESNVYKGAVNGSLWTLPFELYMYALLAFLGAFAFISPRMISRKTFTFLIVVIAAVSMFAYLLNQVMHYTDSYDFIFTSRFTAMFFAGGTLYLLRDRVLLSNRLFFACLITLTFFSSHPQIIMVLYSLMVAYLVIYLAYVPSGWIRQFNRLGDYSYGVYIYAFPVQQMVAATIVGVGVTTMIAIAWPVTLILAMLSWHIIEKPMLGKKDCYLMIKAYLHRLPFVASKK